MRRNLDQNMKVTIDTRHDTLEEALGVVTLAFGSNGKAATSKTRRQVERATSGRKQRGQESASRTVPEPAPTKAAASKAQLRTRTVTKNATANGLSPKAKRAGAKKTSVTTAGTPPPRPANVAPPGQSDSIRAWARSRGMQVADAGRMSAAVIAAYHAQHD